MTRRRWVGALLLAVLLDAALVAAASATWKPQYASQPAEVQAWYRNAELTPEAQKRFHFAKCCDHSDVVKTRFEVSKKDGRDVWLWWNPDKPGPDKWQRIPDDVIHWGESAPGGQPTLFVFQGRETCFFPGQGGI